MHFSSVGGSTLFFSKAHIYMYASMDVSEAFDKVNHGKWFNTLYKRNLPIAADC